jgi:hypothetical protein
MYNREQFYKVVKIGEEVADIEATKRRKGSKWK